MITPKRTLLSFVPLLRRGYCEHTAEDKEPGDNWCPPCQLELAGLIEKTVELWRQHRMLEHVDPLDPDG